MRVLPTTEWSGGLNVTELPPFLVIAVLEFPEHWNGSEMYAQHAAVAIANSRRRLDNFHLFPRRRQSCEGSGLGVPAKNAFGGGFDP